MYNYWTLFNPYTIRQTIWDNHYIFDSAFQSSYNWLQTDNPSLVQIGLLTWTLQTTFFRTWTPREDKLPCPWSTPRFCPGKTSSHRHTNWCPARVRENTSWPMRKWWMDYYFKYLPKRLLFQVPTLSLSLLQTTSWINSTVFRLSLARTQSEAQRFAFPNIGFSFLGHALAARNQTSEKVVNVICRSHREKPEFYWSAIAR
jgi:hypothetical protein